MRLKTYISVLVTILAAGAATAADGTWTADANGNWSDTGNWSGGIVADGTDSTATFGNVITADRTVTVDSPRVIGNIIHNDADRHIIISGGSALTMDVSSGTPTIHTGDEDIDISATLAGSDGLKKTGSGRVNITGANTFTGGLILEGGSVGENGSGVSAASLNNNDITVNASSTMICNGGTTVSGDITLNNASVLTTGNNNSTITFNGAITGSGGIRIIKVGDGGNTIRLNSTANSFTGGVNFASGRGISLFLNSFVDSESPGEGNILFSSPRSAKEHWFILNTGISSPLTLNNRQFGVTDSGADASNESIGIRNNSSHDFTVNTDMIVGGSGGIKRFRLGGTAAGTNTFAGDITNGAASFINLIKEDACTWILSGENTYSGETTVNAGTLVLEGSACLSDTATLNIVGGKVHMEDREVIGALQFGGVSTNSGRWGATGSGAENIDDTYFTGTEILYVGVDFPPSGTILRIK